MPGLPALSAAIRRLHHRAARRPVLEPVAGNGGTSSLRILSGSWCHRYDCLDAIEHRHKWHHKIHEHVWHDDIGKGAGALHRLADNDR